MGVGRWAQTPGGEESFLRLCTSAVTMNSDVDRAGSRCLDLQLLDLLSSLSREGSPGDSEHLALAVVTLCSRLCFLYSHFLVISLLGQALSRRWVCRLRALNGRLRNALAPGHSWARSSGLTNEVTHLSSLRAQGSLPDSFVPFPQRAGWI